MCTGTLKDAHSCSHALYSPRLQVQVAMSKFRQAYVKKTSPLFDGESIFKQLHHSSFGRFQSAVQSVNSLWPDVDLTFELPTVIVIGGRSAGKSSLLENITKCSVFPRHRDVCTKRPIKLQLKQVSSPEAASVQVWYKDTCVSLESTDDILGHVQGIMKDLNTITNDEIVIKICQVRCLQNPNRLCLRPACNIHNLSLLTIRPVVPRMTAQLQCIVCPLQYTSHLTYMHVCSSYSGIKHAQNTPKQ